MTPDKTPHDRTQQEFIEELRAKLVKLLRIFEIGMTVCISVIIVLLIIIMILGTRLYRIQGAADKSDTNVSTGNDVLNSANGLDASSGSDAANGSDNQNASMVSNVSGSLNDIAGKDGQNSQASGTAGTALDSDNRIRVYLTFDDGPSSNTDEILDILKKYNVKGTFFVVGKKGAENEKLYRRIVAEGSTLGMHSYSHDYEQIYSSLDAFQTDLHKIQNYLYDVTGVWTTYYRFPGGSSNTASKTDMTELEAYLGRENITYFDWNIYGGDNVSSASILRNIENSADGNSENMILLHDASDKDATVRALPHIIEYYQAEPDKYQIVPVTEDTVPVQHRQNQ